jgi:hypothetical protein
MSMNRRHFLAGSAAAGLAFGQTAAAVNTAVIGTGGRGTYLLRGVIEQSGAKVAALCDIKPDRLDKAATLAARDNPTTYTDWRKIIDRKDVDAVFTGHRLPAFEMAIAAPRRQACLLRKADRHERGAGPRTGGGGEGVEECSADSNCVRCGKWRGGSKITKE